MSQHNSNNASFDLWRSARGRERMRARFEIRERVSTGQLVSLIDNTDTTPTTTTTPNECTNDLSGGDVEVEVLTKTFLRHVSNGAVASFSLSVLSKQAPLLTRPVPSSLLSDYKITTLCTSRFGREHAAKVLEFCMSARATCTMMEYAGLIGEYKIIGALQLGGIDPTVSGEYAGRGTQSIKVNKDVPVRLQRRFFDCFPLSLSTYILKRVVDMRFQGWMMSGSNNSLASSCDLCFGEPCNHRFSEEHFWLDLLKQLDHRTLGDVVRCPTCGEGSPLTKEDDYGQGEGSDTSPELRYQQSIDKYLALPANSRELKARSKGKAPRKRVLSATWDEAVSQSLGNSRDVRRDKFFSFVERSSIHYVRGCLQQGIDANLVNDYGQTALYLSSWKGNTALVDLLLSHGANPSIAANGGSTALTVAKANNQGDIVSVLERFEYVDNMRPLFDSEHKLPPSSRLEILIPAEADHPGAGACIIDKALHREQLEALVQLQKRLPLALSDKKITKNAIPCSNRHYFSDAHGRIRPLLEAAIARTMLSSQDCKTTPLAVTVLPHMRFLNYEHAGSVLAPHVDLCRVYQGQRSTHTFILYLHTCDTGGETVLLQNVSTPNTALATVTPTRGRLLLFPHNCPHMGAEVIDIPKLLLRGEVLLSNTH